VKWTGERPAVEGRRRRFSWVRRSTAWGIVSLGRCERKNGYTIGHNSSTDEDQSEDHVENEWAQLIRCAP
jgi:hypothetical protein